MNKWALILLVFTSLTGCLATVPFKHTEIIGYANHPEFGDIPKTDQRYVGAVNDCNNRFYSESVNVNGKLIKDRKYLNRILMKEVRSEARKVERANKSGELVKDTNMAMEYAKKAPDYILEIRRKSNQFSACLKKEKKFTSIKGKVVDKRNGNELKYDENLKAYVPITSKEM